ncbi:MAG: HAD family hydrolase [Firmicutes bacterium]|nr:HAD family hydrolase [Bacillota bacterium]
MIRTIAFDADDTLWPNERHFRSAEAFFRDLMSAYHDAEWIQERLFATEMRNLAHFGYGVKSFVLSMIETAIELSEGQIQGRDIQRLVDLGRDMLAHPVEPLPHVQAALAELQSDYRLMLITKGDLLDQRAKLARSGLDAYFPIVEVVPEKDVPTYRDIIQRHGLAPETFLMVGNSVKSDILPVLALGARAVHIPCPDTWIYEHVDDVDATAFATLEHLGLLKAWLEKEAAPPQSAQN